MTKNSKRNLTIGAATVACAALICGIGVQFIGKDGGNNIVVEKPQDNTVKVSISTTAAMTTVPIEIIENDLENGNGNTDTTRPPETEIKTEITAKGTWGEHNADAGDTENEKYPEIADESDKTWVTAVTTAVYETRETIVVEQNFEMATKPTEPPAPVIEDEAVLTDMENEPQYEEEQIIITTAPPRKPQNGATSGDQIYFDGVGWIKNEGGGGEGTYDSEMYMNGNKIGYFG